MWLSLKGGFLEELMYKLQLKDTKLLEESENTRSNCKREFTESQEFFIEDANSTHWEEEWME